MFPSKYNRYCFPPDCKIALRSAICQMWRSTSGIIQIYSSHTVFVVLYVFFQKFLRTHFCFRFFPTVLTTNTPATTNYYHFLFVSSNAIRHGSRPVLNLTTAVQTPVATRLRPSGPHQEPATVVVVGPMDPLPSNPNMPTEAWSPSAPKMPTLPTCPITAQIRTAAKNYTDHIPTEPKSLAELCYLVGLPLTV